MRFSDLTLRLHPPDGDDDEFVEWEAEVGFVRHWRPTWPILVGQVGFFDKFTVTMSRLAQRVAIQADASSVETTASGTYISCSGFGRLHSADKVALRGSASAYSAEFRFDISRQSQGVLEDAKPNPLIRSCGQLDRRNE